MLKDSYTLKYINKRYSVGYEFSTAYILRHPIKVLRKVMQVNRVRKEDESLFVV